MKTRVIISSLVAISVAACDRGDPMATAPAEEPAAVTWNPPPAELPEGGSSPDDILRLLQEAGENSDFQFKSSRTDGVLETPASAARSLIELRKTREPGPDPVLRGEVPGTSSGPGLSPGGPRPYYGYDSTGWFYVYGTDRILRHGTGYCRTAYFTTETYGYRTARVGSDVYVRVLYPGYPSAGIFFNPRAWGSSLFDSRSASICGSSYASASMDANHLGWSYIGTPTNIWNTLYEPFL